MVFSNNPPGIIRAHAAATAPDGYLLCDGASYLRTDYAKLFSVIGETFGSADVTHFNVPDGRGRTIYGFDSGDTSFDTLGETGGASTINIAHSHTANAHVHSIAGTTGIPSTASQQSNDVTTSFANGGHTHTFSGNTASQSDTGSNSLLSATQSILMPYIALNWIIKV